MRAIDADALKEYIRNQDGRPFIGITIGEAFQMMVDEQPTIEERKTGHWERHEDKWGLGISFECSECGCFNLDASDYCPDCGSPMEGAEE